MSSAVPPATPSSEHVTTIGRHPAGLYVLFGAEMWERFSYYGMRALLVLYLTNHLEFDRTSALDVYAIYTGLVYLTPILGGIMADRYLGQRKAVLIGGILMALGHFAMAFEPLLNLALGLLILGNGFFKPNISTMVGQLYPQGDTRRDSAYTIFYMGINLGAFIAPLACGYLGESERFGWHYGFGLAGVGMVLGLFNFALFQRTLGHGGFAPGRGAETGERRLALLDWLHVIVLAIAGAAGVALALMPIPYVTEAVNASLVRPTLLLLWIGMAVVYGLIIRAVCPAPRHQNGSPIEEAKRGDAVEMVAEGRGLAGDAEMHRHQHQEASEPEEDPLAPFTPTQWSRMIVILILSAFSIVFWAGFEQSGGTLNLFADNKTDRSMAEPLQNLTGKEVFPASWYQSVNPLGILLLAPLFSILWAQLDRTRFKVNSAAKFGFGLILLGLGMAVMYVADSSSSESDKAGPQWLVFVYLIFTMGELCLSPIGLSLVNKLAPVRVASLMMALWFFCTAAANYLAGKMESYVGEGPDLWGFLIVFSIVPGIVLLLLNPVLKRMAHGRI